MSKLSDFQKFVLDLVNKSGKEELNAGYVATMWMDKKGKYAVASRHRFGYTSSAYKALRYLFSLGLIQQRTYRTSGGYSVEKYSKKGKSK